jgi:hypothetical protein
MVVWGSAPERTAAELLNMDDDKRHRAKIAKLLVEYAGEIPLR